MNYSAIVRSGVAIAAITVSILFSSSASADTVQNAGFETGDTSGWTANGGIWRAGWPVPESDYSGPPQRITIMTRGTNDPITGAPTVFQGNFSARLNDQPGGNDISALTQQVKNYTGNKLYYAWNAVVEPSHGATDSPSFIVKVVDETTGQIVSNFAYSAYAAQNAPTLFRPAGNFVTTDWRVEDIDVTNGHDYKMVFVAVDCIYGGHSGYVYVDGFGNAIPLANAEVKFDPAKGLTQGAKLLLPIGGTAIPDIDTAKVFYTVADLNANLVNPVFVGGTLRMGSGGTVTQAFAVKALGGTIDTNGFDAVFNGGLNGPGGLSKTGAGTLTLAGTSMLNGRFAVNQGALQLNGTLSALAVDVNNGATLSGNGTVVADVNVNAGATLAPGAALGTLGVAGGNVTMATGSTLALDIDGKTWKPEGGAGTYDRVALTGGTTRFAAAGTVAPNLRNIAGGNNTFTPGLGDSFTVVTADAVTGQFSAVAQPKQGMADNTRFDVLYNPRDIRLVVTPGSFATLGAASKWKLNAISAAKGLDAVRPAAGIRAGALQSLFNGLYGMNANQYGLAFQQISGEIHAHALQMAQGAARDTANMALGVAISDWDCATGGSDRQHGAADGGAARSKGADDCNRGAPRVWGRFLADGTTGQEDGTAYNYSKRAYGLVAGISVIDTDTTRIGIGARYSDGDIRTPIGSSANMEGGSVFLYGSHRFGPLSVGATIGWNTAGVNARRDLGLLSGTTTATAGYSIETITAAMEMGYDIPVSRGLAVRPIVGIEYAGNNAERVTEIHADPNQALVLPVRHWDTTRSKLGAEAMLGQGGPVQGRIFASWRHSLDSDATATRPVILGPATWTVSSVVANRDSAEFGVGLSARVTDAIKLKAEYTGTRDGAYKTDRGSIGLSVSF